MSNASSTELDELKTSLRKLEVQNELLWKFLNEKNMEQDSSDCISKSNAPQDTATSNTTSKDARVAHCRQGSQLVDQTSLLFLAPGIGRLKIFITRCVLDYNAKGIECSLFYFNVTYPGHRGWYIQKTLTDLIALDTTLRKDHGKFLDLGIGKFLDKKILFTQSPAVRDIRKKALEVYMQQVVALLPDSIFLQKFLTENVVDESNAAVQTLSGEGFLTKKGGTFGNWNTRYFKINDCQLDYSFHKLDSCKGSISLIDAKVGPLSHSLHQVSNLEEYRHAFVIEKNKKRHILCAENDFDRDEWVVACNNAKNTLNTSASFSKLVPIKVSKPKQIEPSNEPRKPNPLFGIPLENAVSTAQLRHNLQIPVVVHRCIEFMEVGSRMDEEGIYRISGSMTNIKNFKDEFDSKGDVIFDSNLDANVVTGLLKLYLRELPVNILSPCKLPNETPEERHEQIALCMKAVDEISLIKKNLLKVILRHLLAVVAKSAKNKMCMKNISIIFSATLSIPFWAFYLFMTDYKLIFE